MSFAENLKRDQFELLGVLYLQRQERRIYPGICEEHKILRVFKLFQLKLQQQKTEYKYCEQFGQEKSWATQEKGKGIVFHLIFTLKVEQEIEIVLNFSYFYSNKLCIELKLKSFLIEHILQCQPDESKL